MITWQESKSPPPQTSVERSKVHSKRYTVSFWIKVDTPAAQLCNHRKLCQKLPELCDCNDTEKYRCAPPATISLALNCMLSATVLSELEVMERCFVVFHCLPNAKNANQSRNNDTVNAISTIQKLNNIPCNWKTHRRRHAPSQNAVSKNWFICQNNATGMGSLKRNSFYRNMAAAFHSLIFLSRLHTPLLLLSADGVGVVANDDDQKVEIWYLCKELGKERHCDERAEERALLEYLPIITKPNGIVTTICKRKPSKSHGVTEILALVYYFYGIIWRTYWRDLVQTKTYLPTHIWICVRHNECKL